MSSKVNVGIAQIAGPVVQAGSLSQVHLRDLPEGCVDTLMMHVDFNLKSTSDAFTLVVSDGAAEGGDDLDDLLDALLTYLSLFWDGSTTAFNGLSPSQLRTALLLLTRRDIDGTVVNGGAVPASGEAAAAFRATLSLPVALTKILEDGDTFAQGTDRLRDGRIDIKFASSITPNVVLTNGTAAVSGLSINMAAQYDGGQASEVGPTWRAERVAGIKTGSELFPEATRLFLADAAPLAGNPATAFSFLGYRNAQPRDFASRFQRDWAEDVGSYDLTKRLTPLIFPARRAKLADYAASVDKSFVWQVLSSSATLTKWEITAQPRSADAAAAVHQIVGKGGSTRIQYVRPRGAAMGERIQPALAGLAKTRTVPASMATTGAKVASPRQAATRTAADGSKANKVAAKRMAMYRGAK